MHVNTTSPANMLYMPAVDDPIISQHPSYCVNR